MKLLLVILTLLCATVADAASRTVTWDVYKEDPNFKEIRVFRGTGAGCGSSGVILLPLMLKTVPPVQATVPRGTPTPNVYVDATAPDTPGMICYEIVAVNLYGSTMIESARSNRAIMFQSSPVPVPAGTGVQ